jgi:hypothetical protein
MVLIGQTPIHPINHHATPEMLNCVNLLALEFSSAKTFTYPLLINDMSLPRGGIFDICPTGTTCHDGNGNVIPANTWGPPHISHRIGRSVDISRNNPVAPTQGDPANPPGTTYLVKDGDDEDLLDFLAERLGLVKVPEGTIHYELPPGITCSLAPASSGGQN